MALRCAILVLAAVGLIYGTADAQQAPAQPESATTLEDIVVSGRTREASADFVAELSLADVPDRQIARFDFRICPGVIGLRRAAAQAMNDRLAQISYDLGLRVEEPGCRPNILIIAGANAERLTGAINELPKGLDIDTDVSRYAPASIRRLRDLRPVRWWHRTEYIPLHQASRLLEPGRIDMTGAVVMLDMERIGGVNFEALVDYVALVALARIDPEADLTGRDTVLNLFRDEQTRHDFTGLTSWDAAYLSGIYFAPRDGTRSNQDAAVAERMMRRRGSSETADAP